MRSSRSILNAFFVLAVALALVPVAQASIYAMADGVNFNALARQKAQKRAQQNHQYREIIRNPFRLFKRQESDPGTPIPTLPPISNTSTTAVETTTSSVESSTTSLEPTSTEPSTTAESTTESSVTETSTTEGITTTSSSSTDLPASTDVTTTSSEEASSTTTSEETSTTSSEPPSETSTEIPSSTETTSEMETTTIRTTLDTTVKSAFTTAWSTSTYTLPNGSVGTVTQFVVVVPTISPARTERPQETETATGTASLHTNAAGLYTPGPAPMVALMAVLGYVGGAAF
ncbi:hypothetical protein TWF281_004971 [Arthrobotrys megalospora]